MGCRVHVSFRSPFPLRLGVLAILFLGCAGGPKDVVEDGHDVRGAMDAGTQRGGAYAYAARRPLVAIGLADATGIGEEDSHRVIDAVADAAAGCFKRVPNLASGAARITIPIDEGGVVGAPQVTISPQEATTAGMLCLLAPLRMATFAPASADAGARSLTIESAWGP